MSVQDNLLMGALIRDDKLAIIRDLALQLRSWEMSKSMGNHNSEVVDASSVD